MKRVLLIVAGVVCAALIASCMPLVSADFTFDLKSQDSWDVEAYLVTTQEGEILLKSLLAQLSDQANDENVTLTYDWESADEDGNRPLRMNFNDLSPDEVNRSFSDSFTVETVNGQRQVRFYMVPSGYYDVQDYTFTLKGKKVLSSNGQKKGAGTVTWVNPRQPMEAVLIEGRSGLSAGWILFLLGAVLVGGAVILYLRSQKTPGAPAYAAQPPYYPAQAGWQAPAAQQPPANPQTGLPYGALPVSPTHQGAVPAFCTNCGTSLPPTAAFCPQCGSKPK